MEEKKLDLKQLKKEIRELSSRLNTLGTQKEKNYQEISNISSQLNDLLKQANDLKTNKENVGEQIREKKQKRDELNVKVSELASKLKTLKPQKEMPRDHTPARLVQKQVDSLSMRLQTEVFKFKREQAIMSQLKELKQKLRKSLKEEEAIRNYIETRKELVKTKSQADDTHKVVQDIASKNTGVFNELSEVSKKIAALKEKRKLLKTSIDGQKKQIGELDKQLASKLSVWSSGKRKLDDLRLRAEQAEIVKQIQAVETKLKEKKKLTTEDILAMQREAMRR